MKIYNLIDNLKIKKVYNKENHYKITQKEFRMIKYSKNNFLYKMYKNNTKI